MDRVYDWLLAGVRWTIHCLKPSHYRSSTVISFLIVALFMPLRNSSALAVPAPLDMLVATAPISFSTSAWIPIHRSWQPLLLTQRSNTSSASGSNTGRATTQDDEAEELATMPTDIQTILDRGKLIVALLDTDNPPFFMKREGDHLDGLDVQLAKNLAEAMGVQLEFNRSATTFNEVVDTVFNRQADMAVSKISRTMSRIQRVRFSDPYLRMRQGLLVNRLVLAQQTQGRSVPEAVRSLQGKVGVIEGSSYVGFLNQKFPDATVVEYPSWDTIVEAVSSGEILAAYRDELEIKKVVRSSPNAALQMQTIALTDTEDPIAMVFPWDSTHLLAVVNQYLDTENLDYSADTVLQDYADYFDES